MGLKAHIKKKIVFHNTHNVRLQKDTYVCIDHIWSKIFCVTMNHTSRLFCVKLYTFMRWEGGPFTPTTAKGTQY